MCLGEDAQNKKPDLQAAWLVYFGFLYLQSLTLEYSGLLWFSCIDRALKALALLNESPIFCPLFLGLPLTKDSFFQGEVRS